MTWMMVGSFAASAASSLIGANSANKAATKQATANFQQEAAEWDRQTAQNEAIRETNLQNVIRTGYKVGLLNVQRAQAKKAAMQQGVDLSRSVLAAKSAAEANAAAAGAIGSSVSAVMHDIDMRADEVGAQMGADYAAQEENFDVMLHDIIISGQDAQASAVTGTVQKTQMPQLTSFGQALLGAAVDTAGKHYSNRMTLGRS